MLGREGTLVVAPFCDPCRGSSARRQLEELAHEQPWQTWREHKEGKTRYEPRLGSPCALGRDGPANDEMQKNRVYRRARRPVGSRAHRGPLHPDDDRRAYPSPAPAAAWAHPIRTGVAAARAGI